MLYDAKILSKRIGDLRKSENKKKYTLKELSKKIENKTGVYISATQLGKYEDENSTERININNLIAIANFYDVSIDYLIGHTKSKSKNFTKQMVSNQFRIIGYIYEEFKRIN